MGTPIYPNQVILPSMNSHTDPYASINSIDIGDIYIGSNETVKGQMILIEKKYSPSELIKSYDKSFVEGIKKQLVDELVQKIIDNRLVEFTKQEDLNTDEVTYRARMFVTPDDQIRIIRKSGI